MQPSSEFINPTPSGTSRIQHTSTQHSSLLRPIPTDPAVLDLSSPGLEFTPVMSSIAIEFSWSRTSFSRPEFRQGRGHAADLPIHSHDFSHLTEGAISISRHFAGVEAILCDLDGTLADTEAQQELAWKQSVEHHLEEAGPSCSETKSRLKHLAHAHITLCFEKGAFNLFAPGLFDALKETLPPILTNSRDFYEYLSQIRNSIINKMFEEGTIRQVNGAEAILRKLSAHGKAIGLYTNSPREVGELAISSLLGRDFGQVIPHGFRLFGEAVPDKCKKPEPWGWRYLCEEMMGLHPSKTIILEDRSPNVETALEDGFAGAIGICHDKDIDSWIKVKEKFGRRVVLVRDFDNVTV